MVVIDRHVGLSSPKGDGMVLSPILSAGAEVVESNEKRSRAGCPRDRFVFML